MTSDNEADVRRTIVHLSNAAERMDALASRLDSLRAVTQALATRVNDGDGTLGRLVNDRRLYDDLNQSIVSLRALIDDIKQHPKKYFKFSVF